MAVDEKLMGYVRAALSGASTVREVKMFGGVGFMLNGNMVAAASERGLLVRVGEVGKAEALARGAKPMVMNGRQMRGFVWVDGQLDRRTVKFWVLLAKAFVDTMPAKAAGAKAVRRKRRKS